MTHAERFGRNLRMARRRAGLTQRELADAALLTTDGVQKIELGRRRPRIDTVLKLAEGLEIDPCDLIRGPG
jgi:transcriptional regulator with XRE-family HTH domain